MRRALTICAGINLDGAVNLKKRILVGVHGNNYIDSRIQVKTLVDPIL